MFDDIDFNKLTPEDMVRLAYLALLKRQADEVGIAYWKEKIDNGTFDYRQLLDMLYTSPEFTMLYRKPFSDMVHSARVQWCGSLEHFETILDIGGSSPNIEMGALIELGYKHRPRQITIFDLPEEMQYWGKPRFQQDRDYVFDWGRVHHVHGFVEKIHEIRELAGARFDCIFMGQVIEHIRREDIVSVLKWIKAHLKDRGKFIFDTPNRIITRIQCGERFCDKDHKHEYMPDELESILNSAGLRVIKKTGIVGMPDTLRSNAFNPLETYESEPVNTDPRSSYIFAFECISS